jgi:hypothetical protein
MGSPTSVDRTNHPDGGSALALGCTRRPASGPAERRILLVMMKGGSELEPVLVIEVGCLTRRRWAEARDTIHSSMDVVHTN